MGLPSHLWLPSTLTAVFRRHPQPLCPQATWERTAFPNSENEISEFASARTDSRLVGSGSTVFEENARSRSPFAVCSCSVPGEDYRQSQLDQRAGQVSHRRLRRLRLRRREQTQARIRALPNKTGRSRLHSARI